METKTAEMRPSLKVMVESILKTHHEPTREAIELGKALLVEAASLPESDLINKLGMAFQSLAMTMQMHMEKEEQVLFPMFERMEDGFNSAKFCGGIENPIRVMQNEHQELDFHFDRIRKLTQGYAVTHELPVPLRRLYRTLAALEADLKVHSQKEEQELFPAAVAREKAAVARQEGGVH